MSASLLLELAPPFFALFIELISFPKDRFLEHAAERLLDDEEVEPYVIKDRPGETHIRHRLTSKIADTCRGSVCFYSIAPTLIAVVATLETLKSEGVLPSDLELLHDVAGTRKQYAVASVNQRVPDGATKMAFAGARWSEQDNRGTFLKP